MMGSDGDASERRAPGEARPGMQLSVVVPAYNEEATLSEFHRRLTDVLEVLRVASEVIYVDDGSADGTREILEVLQERDGRVTVVELSRNYGKEIAMTAGLDYSEAEATIVIDSDLQDPPEVIPDLLREWEQGYDVVYARRLSRSGESLAKRATAHLFYRIMRRVSRVNIPEDTGDFRLLSRRAVKALRRLREQHRFMKGLYAWIGFSQKSVPYKRDARYAGTTKWNYWRLWNFAIEGITSFTIAPLKLASYVGFVIAALAFLFGALIVVQTLLFGNPVKGYPSLMVVVTFLGGIQLIFIGIIGEYVGRMFEETKRRPLYLVDETRAGRWRRQAAEPDNGMSNESMESREEGSSGAE